MSADDFHRVARQLDNLVPKNKKDAMQRVVLQGESLMKRETPVKTGALRRSITSRVERGGDRGIIGTNLKYARAVNDGSKPHIIRPKRAKALKTPYGYFKVVRHPGTKARMFVEHTREKLRPVAERELANIYGAALGKIS
jgi:phage gpG-like protein